jgi:hypothetical protein
MDKIVSFLLKSVLQFLRNLSVVGIFSWLCIEYLFCVQMYYYII